MAVNVNGIDMGGTTASPAHKTSPAPSTATDSGDAALQPGFRVSITSIASLLARLQQALAAQSPVDLQRVDAIRSAIAAGTYAVHADSIAQGLIHTERALAQLKRE